MNEKMRNLFSYDTRWHVKFANNELSKGFNVALLLVNKESSFVIRIKEGINHTSYNSA